MQTQINFQSFLQIVNKSYHSYKFLPFLTISYHFWQFLTISCKLLKRQILTTSCKFLQICTNLYKFLQFLKIFWQILVHSNSFLKIITNSYQFEYFLTISDHFWPILTNFNICLQSLIISVSYNFFSYEFLQILKFLKILTTSNNFYNF